MRKPFLILLIILAFVNLSKAQKADTASTHTAKTEVAQDDITLSEPSVKVNEQSEERAFTVVEHEPKFPGGMEKLNNYIKAKMQSATGYGSGSAFVTFVVETDGGLSDIKILRNTGQVANADIIQLMTNCPKWNAGVQHGKKVRVQYAITVDLGGD